MRMKQLISSWMGCLTHDRGDVSKSRGDVSRSQGDVSQSHGDVSRSHGDVSRSHADRSRGRSEPAVSSTTLVEPDEPPATRTESDAIPQQFPEPFPERVTRLLEDAQGRMLQSDIEAEMGWSASKTSRNLCQLEQDGVVSRYRVGRQKVVCLPSHEPELAQSSTAD